MDDPPADALPPTPDRRAGHPRIGGRDVTPEVAAEHLRERVYGTVAVLASLVTLADPRYAQSAASSALTLVVTVGSLWLASLFADVTAHLAVHGRVRRPVLSTLVSSRTEMLATAVVPLALIGAAALGWWELGTALGWAAGGQVATLGLVGVLAVRRADLPWVVKALVVAAEVALGLVVVGVKLLAH